MISLPSTRRRLTLLLLPILFISVALFTGSVIQLRTQIFRARHPAHLTAARAGKSSADLPVPGTIADEVALREGPISVPLEFQMPSLNVSAKMLGVGIMGGAMDAPVGRADDPVWQEAFWYRGSAVPGEPSTALIAGHMDDSLGRPAVFAHIDSLKRGDLIVIRDIRSGLDVRFSVTDSKTYLLTQMRNPAILTQVYGAGPVAGTWSQPSADGLSHLTLVTCVGPFKHGTHDHRLVVYATRVP